MASTGLHVDPVALKAAGVQAAAGSAHSGAVGVDPCANDVVSAGVAARLSRQLGLARDYTVAANSTAQRFGLLLDANAAAYEEQEAVSAADLGGSSAPEPTVPVNTPPVPAGSSPTKSTGR